MESSRTSDTATTTNGTMISVSTTTAATTTTATMDKPDELVSSGEIRQMSSGQGQHGGETAAPASAIQRHHHYHPYQQHQQQPQLHQHNSHQHKKCLHHRILDANNTNSINERVAALTNVLLQQVTQQNLTQGSQIIQRPFPLQQAASAQQSHLIRQQQQQHQIQTYQQYPMQQIPTTTTIGISSAMIPSNGGGHGGNGTHFTIGINNTSVGGSAAAAPAATTNSSGPIIHNQNGLVQKMNAALLAERYLLLDLVEGSTLYKCIDVKTHEELVCKVIENFGIFIFTIRHFIFVLFNKKLDKS